MTALLCGINQYLDPSNNLNGCVNDVYLMCKTLLKCGFDKSKIYGLVDSQATRKNILQGLRFLVFSAKPGDKILFYYSGHGSQISDENGDEADAYDEIICPHDFDWRKKTWISDDEFRGIINLLPPDVVADFIFDSCHSGTMTRAFSVVRKGIFSKKTVVLPHPRFITNPGRDMIIKQAKPRAKLIDKEKMNHMVLTACASSEVSQELPFRGKVQGAFTKNLCDILNTTKAHISRVDVQQELIKRLKLYNQTPQLEGSIDRANFCIFC